MRRFAEVHSETLIVVCVFDWPVEDISPEFDPTMRLSAEVTDLNPEPPPGSVYDPDTGEFTFPPAPEPPPEEPTP